MKKIISVLLAASLLAFTITGCTVPAKETEKAAPSAETSANKAEDAGTAAQPSTDEKMVLKVGTTAPPTTLVAQSAIMFGEKLKELSGGAMDIDLVSAGALGTTPQHYSQMQQGDLDIFVTAFDTATVMKDSKDFSIFVVPYAFNDIEHFRKFLETDTFMEMKNKAEAANGIHFLGCTGNMLPRCLSTTNTPVYTPADLKNLKIRTPEAPAIVTVWTKWGANPIQTAGSEIYSSLESGLIDGQDNDVVGSTSTPLYEVQSYYMELNYIQQANIMWASQMTWDKLSEQQRQWVEQAIEETDKDFSTDLFDTEYPKAKKLMEESGVEFIEFDREAFVDLAAETVKEMDGTLFRKGLYDEVRALVE